MGMEGSAGTTMDSDISGYGYMDCYRAYSSLSLAHWPQWYVHCLVCLRRIGCYKLSFLLLCDSGVFIRGISAACCPDSCQFGCPVYDITRSRRYT